MESFFFNTKNGRYQRSEHLSGDKNRLTQVDISNGLIYLELSLEAHNSISHHIKNLDRAIAIVTILEGSCEIEDHIGAKKYRLEKNQTYLFGSSRQELSLTIPASQSSKIFVLFVADFFIKRYLSNNDHEPIDYLYLRLQEELSLELLSTTPTDALSLYFIDKLQETVAHQKMHAIISEQRAMQYLIHRLSLLELDNQEQHSEAELEIAQRAREIMLQNFKSPPSIKELAHQCATNDFKLKSYFKKVYQTTLYAYVQKLRLEKANILLREEYLSVAEVAQAVGYKHQGHFSSIFFKTYGVYPKALKYPVNDREKSR